MLSRLDIEPGLKILIQVSGFDPGTQISVQIWVLAQASWCSTCQLSCPDIVCILAQMSRNLSRCLEICLGNQI